MYIMNKKLTDFVKKYNIDNLFKLDYESISEDIRYLVSPAEKLNRVLINTDTVRFLSVLIVNDIIDDISFEVFRIKNDFDISIPNLSCKRMSILFKNTYIQKSDMRLEYSNLLNFLKALFIDDSITFNNNTEFNEEEQMVLLDIDIFNIRYIKNPSDKTIEYFLNRFCKSINKEIRIYKLTEGENIEEIMQLYNIKQYPKNIRNIKEPSEKIQLAAVEKCGSYIRYIHNPSKAVQLAAVKQDSTCINYIKTPCKEVLDYLETL